MKIGAEVVGQENRATQHILSTTTRCINEVLPKEILRRIITALSPSQRVRIERVCRLWLWISMDTWFAERTLVVDFRALRADDAIQQELRDAFALARRIGPLIQQLELYDFKGNMRFGTFYFELVAHTPNLEHVLIDNGRINQGELFCIGQFTPDLIGLSIDLLQQPVEHANALNKLFQACAGLICLKLVIHGVGSVGLQALPGNLEELALCIRNFMVLRQYLAGAKYCPQLRMLTIDGTMCDISGELMELRARENLKYFKYVNNNVEDKNIQRLLPLGFFAYIKCCELELLDGEILPLIIEHCRHLEFFAFERLKDIRLEQLVELKKLRSLKHLQCNAFRHCRALGDMDVGILDWDHLCASDGSDDATIEHEKLLAAFAAIVADGNGTIQHLFIDMPVTAEYLVNLLIRQCKSLFAITCRVTADELDAAGALICALATEEMKLGIYRQWPLHIILTQKNVDECFLGRGKFPQSAFVCWHEKQEQMEQKLTRKMLQQMCGKM